MKIQKPPAAGKPKQSFEHMWPRTGNRFTQIPSILMKNHHRIMVKTKKGAKKEQRPLNSSEMLLLFHLISFYWSVGKPPRPTVATLAKLMALQPRSIRDSIHTLRDAKLIETETIVEGGPNRYKLTGLLDLLQQFHAEDEAKKIAAAQEAA